MALLVILHRGTYLISDNGQIKIVFDEYEIKDSQHNGVFYQLTVS
jgi:hypothetical protein